MKRFECWRFERYPFVTSLWQRAKNQHSNLFTLLTRKTRNVSKLPYQLCWSTQTCCILCFSNVGIERKKTETNSPHDLPLSNRLKTRSWQKIQLSTRKSLSMIYLQYFSSKIKWNALLTNSYCCAFPKISGGRCCLLAASRFLRSLTSAMSSSSRLSNVPRWRSIDGSVRLTQIKKLD